MSRRLMIWSLTARAHSYLQNAMVAFICWKAGTPEIPLFGCGKKHDQLCSNGVKQEAKKNSRVGSRHGNLYKL